MRGISRRTGATVGVVRGLDASITALLVLANGHVAVGTESGSVVVVDPARVRGSRAGQSAQDPRDLTVSLPGQITQWAVVVRAQGHNRRVSCLALALDRKVRLP